MKKRSHHPFIFLFIVLIVFLSGIFLILFSRIKPDKQHNELLSLGDKYLQELNYEDAAIAFQNAIEISEREQTAYLRLAETYTAAQDYNRAADVLVAGYDTADDNTLIQSRMIAVYSLVSPSRQEQIHQRIPQDVPDPTQEKPAPSVTAAASPTTTPTASLTPEAQAPPAETNSDGSFTEEQLDTIRQMLRIPENLDTTVTQSAPSYWDAGERWLIQVTFYNSEGVMIAGAAFDQQTMEMCRNIYMYSGG